MLKISANYIHGNLHFIMTRGRTFCGMYKESLGWSKNMFRRFLNHFAKKICATPKGRVIFSFVFMPVQLWADWQVDKSCKTVTTQVILKNMKIGN